MKDAANLLLYFFAVVLIGALLAPPLYWAAQSFSHVAAAVSKAGFESFFHRALLLSAILLLWPLLRWCRVRSLNDLELAPNQRWGRDLLAGFLFASIPLLLCASVIVLLHIYSIRVHVDFAKLGAVIAAAIVTPLIEETFFRGLILGVLLRSFSKHVAILFTATLFSLIHFLKAPEQTSALVTWTSGFRSIGHAFDQFRDPMLLVAAFTTLFLLGWILGDARVRTRSLWAPIGLHAGWIFAAGVFNRMAHRDQLALPWLGKSLLVGLVPLAVALVTWCLIILWINKDARPRP